MQSWMLLHHKQIIACLRCTYQVACKTILYYILLCSPHINISTMCIHLNHDQNVVVPINLFSIFLSFLDQDQSPHCLCILIFNVLIQILHKFPLIGLIFIQCSTWTFYVTFNISFRYVITMFPSCAFSLSIIGITI